MPNAKVLSEKQALVAALTERIQNASSGVFVDYKGINVAQDTELRTELRKNEVEYSVVKNTLTRFALDNCGLQEMNGILNGTTSLATSTGDPIAPFRVINDYSKKLKDIFTIKELQAVAQRLAVARLLKKKVTYQDIAEQTGASTATISRVNRSLTYGAGGYQLVLSRLGLCAPSQDEE